MGKDNLAAFQLTHLQNIIDERKQMLGGNLHFLLIRTDEGMILRMRFINFQQTDNAV